MQHVCGGVRFTCDGDLYLWAGGVFVWELKSRLVSERPGHVQPVSMFAWMQQHICDMAERRVVWLWLVCVCRMLTIKVAGCLGMLPTGMRSHWHAAFVCHSNRVPAKCSSGLAVQFSAVVHDDCLVSAHIWLLLDINQQRKRVHAFYPASLARTCKCTASMCILHTCHW